MQTIWVICQLITFDTEFIRSFYVTEGQKTSASSWRSGQSAVDGIIQYLVVIREYLRLEHIA